METAEEKWVGYVLMEAKRKKSISKILSMEWKDAVEKGNNYISDIYRLKVRVLTNSGDVEERSVIYKRIPVDGKDKLPGIRELGLFEIEAKMYQKTLAAMGRLMKSKDKEEEVLWPEFYGVKGNFEAFLLEDLSVDGYVTIDREKGLDFQHTAVCLQNLAKFHALAAVFLKNGTGFDKARFPENFFLSSREKIKRSSVDMAALINAIKADWPIEWLSYVDGLKKVPETLGYEILKIYEKKDNMFMTINHGDFWINNFLFKYDSSGNLMKTMRFIDYQLPFVHSPCYDIQFLFSTSLRLECYGRKPELLKLYHESLEKYLNLFGYKKRPPSYEELLRDFTTTTLFGHFVTLKLQPFKRNPSIHDLVKRFGVPEVGDERQLIYRHDGEEYLAIIRLTLLQLRQMGKI